MSENYNKILVEVYERLRDPFIRRMKSKFPKFRDEDICDIYQDIIIVLWTNYNAEGKLRVEEENPNGIREAFEKLIHKIGKNQMAKLHEFKKRNPIVDLAKAVEAEGITDEEFVDFGELRIAVKKLEDNNERCYKILFKQYWESYSMKKIAKMMGLKNEDSARTTKKRCLEKLREIYIKLLKKGN